MKFEVPLPPRIAVHYFCFMFIFRLIVVLLLSYEATAYTPMSVTGSFQVTHTFSGGLPDCSNCGAATEYSCSPSLSTGKPIGNWSDGVISFLDQIPKGLTALSVSMLLHGAYDCDQNAQGGSNITLMFQKVGYLTQGYVTGGGGNCKCGECDTDISFCGRNPLGLEGYAYGGSNDLTIYLPPDQSSSICLHQAVVTVSYGHPAVYEAPTEKLIVGIPYVNYGGGAPSPYCLQTGLAGGPYTMQLTFTDPFPAGFVVYMVNITFYGSDCMNGGQDGATSVTFSLQDLAINSTKTIVDQCSSGSQIRTCTPYAVTSPRYQTGWPNYVYGGQNTITAQFNGDDEYDNYWICATRLEVGLTAYESSEAKF